jgi:flagellin-like hook-associated protein FlgL
MATAVTNLAQAETVQQALVQAGGQISQTNLFDYLPTQ